LNPDIDGDTRPETPDNIRRWRKCNDPGKRVIHPALVEDFKKLDISNTLFGDPSAKADQVNADVDDILGSLPRNERDEIVTECSERIYKRKQLEPLGKSYSRGHKQPHFITNPDFRYGTTSTKSNDTAKVLIYSCDENILIENLSVQENYIKSHCSYKPGEQKRRNYCWPIDPRNTIFGDKSQDAALRQSSVGVRDALNFDSECSMKKQASRDIKIPESAAFGVDTEKVDYHGTECRAVMRGNYTVYEQYPDCDLGKSVTPGYRNVDTKVRIINFD